MKLTDLLKTGTGATAIGAVVTAGVLIGVRHDYDNGVLLGLTGVMGLFGRRAIGKVLLILERVLPLLPKVVALLENLDAQAAKEEAQTAAVAALPPAATTGGIPPPPPIGTPQGYEVSIYSPQGWTKLKWNGQAWAPAEVPPAAPPTTETGATG